MAVEACGTLVLHTFNYQKLLKAMTQTGKCPNCYAVNSFGATHCLDCNAALPWASAIAGLQQQLDAANATIAQNQQQNQLSTQAQVRQNIAQAQAARAQSGVGNASSAPLAPGQPLAVNVFHVFADAFVGRFAETLDGIDKSSAAWFGLFCMVVSNACLVIGARLIFQNITDALHAFLPFPTAPTPPNPLAPDSPSPEVDVIPGVREVIALWKLIVVAFTPWLVIAASCTLARKLFGGEERHLEGDVFVAGVTLLPFSLLVLLTGALGYGNWEIVAVLFVFALCYSILLLYRGLSTVSNIRDMAAAFCVPLVIMGSGYLAKIVFTRLITL